MEIFIGVVVLIVVVALIDASGPWVISQTKTTTTYHGGALGTGDCRCGCGHDGVCHLGRGCVCGRGDIA